MKRIFIPTQNPSDWEPFLANPAHWKKGCSAMATAASWEAANGEMPKEIVGFLNNSGLEALAGLELLAALPEWKVSFKPEGGTPSRTDVMAFTRNKNGLVVIAVEAKVKEPFNEKLPQRTARIKELLKVLQLEDLMKHLPDALQLEKLTEGPLKIKEIKKLIKPYQLFHRTASAIKTARDFHASTAIMLVHSFSETKNHYAKFKSFCDVMGGKEVVSNYDLFVVPRFNGPKLYLGWCQGDSNFLEVDLDKKHK